MSISSRIERVRPEDLLDDAEPGERLPRLAVSARRQLTGLALAVLALPLVTLLLDASQPSVSLETVVLVYLLAVVAVAMVGGVLVAIAAAVAAALLINFFFVEPVHTFDIARGEQALALGAFVVVAVAVSGAVELAARRARAAEQAAAEAETLLSLAGTDFDAEASLKQVLEGARRTFGMESVSLKSLDRATGGRSSTPAGRRRGARRRCGSTCRSARSCASSAAGRSSSPRTSACCTPSPPRRRRRTTVAA
jgi:two-component system sensor histidine kinase KdpD